MDGSGEGAEEVGSQARNRVEPAVEAVREDGKQSVEPAKAILEVAKRNTARTMVEGEVE
jgi:YbbR domain-containing protein